MSGEGTAGRSLNDDATVSCVALDFGGTIAESAADPGGDDVVAVLRVSFGCEMPPGFAEVVDAERKEARSAYRRSSQQTSWEEILRTAALRMAVSLPDVEAVVEALWAETVDATVYPSAVTAVHTLRAAGYPLLLACNTRRPPARRIRTLKEAGIYECFDALLLSSALGVAKPRPEFYAAVIEAARVHAGCGPEEILFVGDTLGKDVTGPCEHGMRAVLIGGSADAPAEVPVISRLADLPALLADGR